MKHEKFIQLAVRTAYRSESKFRLGAVLVKKNRVLSWGINKMDKSHPVQQEYSDVPFLTGLHAEIHSCIGLHQEDLEGSSIYVARLLKNGKTALALPCDGCQRFMKVCGVREAFYTDSQNSSFSRLPL